LLGVYASNKLIVPILLQETRASAMKQPINLLFAMRVYISPVGPRSECSKPYVKCRKQPTERRSTYTSFRWTCRT
jgi:hypothetical protein